MILKVSKNIEKEKARNEERSGNSLELIYELDDRDNILTSEYL